MGPADALTLERIGAFALLGVAAALVPLWVRSCRRRQARVAAFTGGRFPLALGTRLRWTARAELAGILGLGLCGLGLVASSAAAPRLADPRAARDLMFVLDVSRSMLAEDRGPAPSRLDAARELATTLALSSGARRLGLVLVAGDAQVSCPLTLDRDAFASFLDAAAPGLAGAGGTALAAGILRALEHLRVPSEAATSEAGAPGVPGARPGAAIVLLSDGEEQRSADRVKAAARAAGQAGVPIFTGSLTGPDGAPLFETGPSGTRVPVRDASGRAILSQGDPALLDEIARLSGGASLPREPGIGPGLPKETGPARGQEGAAGWLLLGGVSLLLVEALQRAGR